MAIKYGPKSFFNDPHIRTGGFLPELEARVGHIAMSTDRAARQAVRDWAEKVAIPEIQRNAPVADRPYPGMEPIRLIDSYRAFLVNQNQLRIGTTQFYAAYQEFGTSRNVAHPHFVPGMRRAMQELPGLVGRYITRAIITNGAVSGRKLDDWDMGIDM